LYIKLVKFNLHVLVNTVGQVNTFYCIISLVENVIIYFLYLITGTYTLFSWFWRII